jgi:hypothetical protein
MLHAGGRNLNIGERKRDAFLSTAACPEKGCSLPCHPDPGFYELHSRINTPATRRLAVVA